MNVNEADMTIVWDDCEHEWKEPLDSQSLDPDRIDVVCEKCGCPGEKNLNTGKVFWPAT